MSTKSTDKSNEKKLPEEQNPEGHPNPEELMNQLNEAEQKCAQYWDRILRMQAESENAARRAERDIANAHKFALEKFLNQLLPVIDNLERAVSVSKESKVDAAAILEGVDLTLKMLYDVLEKSDVKQVNPENEPFNPTFHEAISMQADASCKPGTVVSVLQKGYLLNDRLLRPALVIVSK